MTTFKSHVTHFHLIEEMCQTPDIIRAFDTKPAKLLYKKIWNAGLIMITGEGSSRIFPAKNMVFNRLRKGKGPVIVTQNANDLAGLDLSDMVVIGASNSGRTKELIELFISQKRMNHGHLYGLTCNMNTILENHSHHTVILNTGVENAVAATKSVVAQALFYDMLLGGWGLSMPEVNALAVDFENALETPVDPVITGILSEANHIYFAGMNDGVAEELALKTNEIVRKKSAFFPGSYLLHGVEEVVGKDDVVVMVDDLSEHNKKIHELYVEGIGAKVISLSAKPSLFPSVKLTYSHPDHAAYAKLAIGWKILAETGMKLGIDLDKPDRARKVGNEFG